MASTSEPPRPPSRALLVAAFAAVYVLWGSTYLAMRIGVRTLPPFLLGSARFTVAGALLFGWHLATGRASYAKGRWREAGLTGALLLVGGNGGVVWSVQHIPSGLAALIVGTVPLWIVLLEWMRGTRRPGPRTVLGIGAGLVGIGVLVGPDAFAIASAAGRMHAAGVLVVLAASLSWAIGSLRARRLRIPEAPLLPTSMQMLAGGAGLLLLGAAKGELGTLASRPVAGEALVAVVYLAVCGSLLAYSAYIWLLQVVAPSRVATYAFVNPVVAVLLGWALLAEPITPRTIVSAAIIVGAVALITTAHQR